MAEKHERRALITGGSGFVGFHLFNRLAAEGWDLTILDLGDAPEFLGSKGRFIRGDMTSEESLLKAVTLARPDVVYHLAGIAFVPAAEKDKQKALAVNVQGGLNLFEAVRREAPKARVIVISSSEVYGKAGAEQMPLSENAPVRPANFYAFTKASLENATMYERAMGLQTVVLRPFNHIGPRQSDQFVTSAFARQVAQIEAGRIPAVIRVGNLDAIRDFTDVEDMVRAYQLAGEHDLEHRVYNLCSGSGVAIKEILNAFLDMSEKEIHVETDPDRLRPSDVPVLVGDARRFAKATGWRPAVSLTESLQRILDYWRSHV
ncbi:MAG: GDP-mannose 4,6-dehydratase [Planctomycetota bacterium]